MTFNCLIKYITTSILMGVVAALSGQSENDILDSLIWHHYDQRYITTDNSIVALKELAEKSIIEDYAWGEMKANQLIGELYQIIGNKDSCTYYLHQSLQLSIDQKDDKQTALSYGLLARQELDLGNYPEAVAFYDTAMHFFTRIDDQYNMAYTHADIGWTYMLSDDLDSAMVHSIAFLEYAEKENDTTLISHAYNTIGTIHKKLKQYDKAEELYLKAIRLCESNPQYEHYLVASYNNIGIVYKVQGKYEKAISYYDKKEAIAHKYGDQRSILTVKTNKGSLYNQLGKYSLAEESLTTAVEMARAMNVPIVLADALNNLGKAYLYQNKYQSAWSSITEAIAVATEVGSTEKTMEAYETAKAYYIRKNDPTAAVRTMEKIQTLKDSLFLLEQSAQINELQEKYETAKKEAAIQKLNAEKKAAKQRNRQIWWGFIALIAVLFSLFYGFFQKQKRIKWTLRNAKNLEEARRKSAESELTYKSKELTTRILQLAEKNKLLQSYRSDLMEIYKSSNNNNALLVERLIRRIDRAIDDDDLWNQLIEEFKVVHQDFIDRLGGDEVEFSKAKLRLIALLKMNLSSKDIGKILHITADGVKKARQRLRKKLQLESALDLQSYLLNL